MNFTKFFKPEASDVTPTKIYILTNTDINYKALDVRVLSVGSLMMTCPMKTHIVVRKQHEQDIISLLKAHPEIQRVNNDWTELGRREQEKMRDSISSLSIGSFR